MTMLLYIIAGMLGVAIFRFAGVLGKIPKQYRSAAMFVAISLGFNTLLAGIALIAYRVILGQK